MELAQFLQKTKSKFGDTFDYSKVVFVNALIKIIIICPIHGEFSQSPKGHLRGKGCPKCSNRSSADKKIVGADDFFKRAQTKHGDKYDYSKSYFKGLKKDIIIICKTHGEFVQKALGHLKNGCLKCRDDRSRMTIQQVIDKANKVHNNIYDYSSFTTYINNKSKINVICKIHGLFKIEAYQHLMGKYCQKCSRNDYNNRLISNFLEKVKIIHNNEYTYLIDENFLSTPYINVVCQTHGKFKTLKWTHLKGSKCSKCAKENRKLTMDEFLVQANKIHSEKYDYSEADINYVSNKIKIICYKHGPFWQRVGPHLYSSQGCPNCSKIISKDEMEWLDYIKIPNDLRNKRLKITDKVFYPDGLDPTTNTIYEYYGDYWHGNINVYDPNKKNKLNKMRFIDLYNETLKRELFLKENGYNIISIWETDWKKLKKTIK